MPQLHHHHSRAVALQYRVVSGLTRDQNIATRTDRIARKGAALTGSIGHFLYSLILPFFVNSTHPKSRNSKGLLHSATEFLKTHRWLGFTDKSIPQATNPPFTRRPLQDRIQVIGNLFVRMCLF